MRVKSILFNTEDVRATLDDRKTAIRLIAFKESDLRPFPRKKYPDGWWFRGSVYPTWDNTLKSPQGVMSLCRYRIGDILYVREAWVSAYDGEAYFYLADKCTNREQTKLLDYDNIKWRPSIHMPKEAARIWLRVTNVKVEQLQNMKIEDFLAEGIPGAEYDIETKNRFVKLWNSTTKKSDLDLYGWEANPWVWVIGFERCEKPESEVEE